MNNLSRLRSCSDAVRSFGNGPEGGAAKRALRVISNQIVAGFFRDFGELIRGAILFGEGRVNPLISFLFAKYRKSKS